ncbi:MAG: hypothetical protein JWO82_3674 [Akkermansiaceae bacterium]|nr:hypothetical protein [Akkermansiaceae bacterium]
MKKKFLTGMLALAPLLWILAMCWEFRTVVTHGFDTLSRDSRRDTYLGPVRISSVSLSSKPGYSAEYQAITGKSAGQSRSFEATGFSGGIFVGSYRCGSFGLPYAYRKQMLEGLYQSFRKREIAAPEATAILGEIDALIDLPPRGRADFTEPDFSKALTQVEAIRAKLKMPPLMPAGP